jgi:hypothetical protein
MRLGSPALANVPRMALAWWFAIAAPAPLVAAPVVEVQSGHVIVHDGGQRRTITQSGRDADAVLAPDGKTIVFTRMGRRAGEVDDPHCPPGDADELRRVRSDGSGEELLVRGRPEGEASQMLCDFSRKQFSSDGRYLYFLSRAWATSGALHVYDTREKKESFLLPANEVVVLSACADRELRDRLVVQQHRYFVVGGSYDWYWLYDQAGKKEMGPVGEHENAEAVLAAFNDVRCKP